VLLNRLLLSFIFACFLFSACTVKAEQRQYERFYLAVLDAQIEAQKSGDYHTMDRLFELEHAGKGTDHFLVELLDFYLGAAASEILQELITSKGNNIAPLLRKKRDELLNCPPQYKTICAESIEHRNRWIDEMLEAISRGV